MSFCRGIPNSHAHTLGVHSALCWHVLNALSQGYAGSTSIYPLPCSDKEFISACHAEPIV